MIITSTASDNGLLERIKSVATRFTGTVEIGYFGNTVHKPSITSRPKKLSLRKHKNITLNELAKIHEQGLGVPKRAFMTPALQQNRNKYLKFAAGQITPIIMRRQTLNGAWQRIGMMAVADIQQYMVTAQFTPLSPITIKRKGSSRPLIDSGQMRQSITYRVK